MIELHQIHRTFRVGDNDVYALDGIDLTIDGGEYLSVMGPSGSGKSTLLNLLGLLDQPNSGSYRLNNVETSNLSEEARARLRRDNIGFVFQSYHLIPRLTAWENVELPLMLASESPFERTKKVASVIEKMGLGERAHHLPNQLSGGQRQRVAIARAIVMRPEILLADEPTGNLDTASGQEVIEVLEALNQEGITLMVVTHDQNIGQRAHRHLRMVDGRIVQDVRSQGRP